MAEAAEFQGTSPSAARRWLRRTGALLAGAPLLACLLQLSAAPSARAAPESPVAAPSGSGSVDVALDSLSPAVPLNGDTLTVTGTVTNKGKQTVTGAEVGLRIGPSLQSRSSIDAASKDTQGAGNEGSVVGGKYVEKFSKLPSGVAEPFSISVPVKELDLGADGVYQLGVTLSGRTAAQPYQQVLGSRRTFLPWQPEVSDNRTRTTFLWPLISTMHLTAETGSDELQTPVFKNDDLAKEIAPGGRLDQMLTAGSNLDVTWVIDPDLVASVDAMTRSYRLDGPGDTTTPGGNQAVAKQWLDRLEKTVADKEVVALPFADPDLAALAHNGRSVTGSLSHLKEATDVATTTIETILHVTPDTDYAWPADGAVDPSIIKVATSAGAHTVIARSDSFQESGSLPYTPSAARPIGGGTTAVVADARMSTTFRRDMTIADSSTLAVQEFLAQSLMITLQQPEKQRSIVVAPQRMPTASQAQVMAQALTALQQGNWSQPQTLAAATKAKPDARATTRVPSAKAYPSALRKQELPQAAFQDLEGIQHKLDSFKEILTDSSRVVTPFGRAIDRGVSTSWRGHRTDAAVFRGSVRSYLDKLTSQVALIKKSEAKLSGRSATIPVTVQNNLVQGVDHLVLRLTSTNPTRLKIGNHSYADQQVAVSGGHSQSVKFTTSANANGPVTVIAQLYTEDGQEYGDPVRFDVKVTEITPAVMLVIGGGVLLLVLAGFRMYTQRKRAAAQQSEESGAADETVEEHRDGPKQESDVESGADDPEHPSDPATDTAVESTESSGAGERVDR